MDSAQRDRLRQQWLQQAEAAFDVLFDAERQDQLVTFDQHETLAVARGCELATWLLEQHLADDPAARPAADPPVACPKCRQAAVRHTPAEATPPPRSLTCRSGEVTFRREQWRCPSCRVVFFPLDQRLELGTEGYSPALVRKAVRQAAKAASFQDASADLAALAEVAIRATHVQRLSERVGGEWADVGDSQVEAYRTGTLARDYEAAPAVATVMLDGGRYQTRAEDAGRGVTEPGWKELKVACCQTYAAAPSGRDPQPRPPAKFRDRALVAQLAAELKSAGPSGPPRPAASRPRRRRKARRRRASRRLLRTVVATTQDNSVFGWQVAAEVHRRGLDRATHKACLGDGASTIWSVFELHRQAAGLIAILDFVHLLAYLYAAAGAAEGKGTEAAWLLYQQWLTGAWSGQTVSLVAGLTAVCRRLGAAPNGAAAEDRRRVAADALRYVKNNGGRMDYPRYRRLGLPISRAGVESPIKQLNRRVKGSAKFWLKGGAEALVQVRSAYLSEDGRADRHWRRPRPYARSVGRHRLGRPTTKAH